MTDNTEYPGTTTGADHVTHIPVEGDDEVVEITTLTHGVSLETKLEIKQNRLKYLQDEREDAVKAGNAADVEELDEMIEQQQTMVEDLEKAITANQAAEVTPPAPTPTEEIGKRAVQVGVGLITEVPKFH